MDVIISATDSKLITMIEGFAREVPEDEMLAAHRVRTRDLIVQVRSA